MKGEIMKIYYDKQTGYLCNRYPKNIPIKDDSPFIEVLEEEADQTYVVEYGKFWAVKDNKLVIVDDIELINTDEYKQIKKNDKIAELKQYLNETDYIISKLNELRLEDGIEYQEALVKYKDVLTKRKEARAKINELEVE